MIKPVVFGVVLAGVATAAVAAPPPVRTEIPIRDVVLSDGVHRYGVSISIGTTTIEAGLDSGSSGLRVLPNVLGAADAKATEQPDSYDFGAGAKLDGVIGEGAVAVGAQAGDARFQLVRKVGCNDRTPHCAAGSIPLAQYGIQGDGLPGEGFKAILGVNMADAGVPSLFSAIGARRWIIELPRPGQGGPGRIVLNPTDAETQGFVAVPILARFYQLKGGLHDSVSGCIVNTATKIRLCGAVLLDTGAPGIRIVTASGSYSPWAEGAAADILLADTGGNVRATEHLTVGRRNQASRVTFEERPNAPAPLIYAGLSPYFAFSVLYDRERGTVAFKPRPPAGDGPVGTTP